MASLTRENLKKVKLSKSQKILLGILVNPDPETGKPGPRPTIEQVTKSYAAKTKKEQKDSSVTTAISQMRKEFKKAGFAYPSQWDIHRQAGGGRTAERESVDDIFNDLLGDDFDIDSVMSSGVEEVEEEETAAAE